MDVRPATNQLYALTIDASNTGRLYAVNAAAMSPATTITASPIGTLSVTLSGTQFGVDFNPTTPGTPGTAGGSALRIVSNTGQNLRVAMLSNATVTTTADTTLTFGGSTATGIFAAAYTNNDNDTGLAGATGTTLFVLNATDNTLALQGSDPANGTAGDPGNPNTGIITTRGALGFDVNDVGGFDILTANNDGITNTGYAVLNTDAATSTLYTINLTSGVATVVGSVTGIQLRSFAIAQTATEDRIIYAATTSNNLIRFNARTPGTIDATIAITDLTGTLVGIDFRPSSPGTSNTRRLLYGLAQEPVTSTGRIYSIDLATGVATLFYTLTTPLEGDFFGVDFNPVPDALRIVSDTGQNLRIAALASGSPTTNVDSPLNNGGSGTITGVTAAAYTNADSSTATGTALYGINTENDTLVLQGTNPSNGTAGNPGNPNAGVITNVGTLGIITDVVNGFDISSSVNSIVGYAAFGTDLVRINLVTGEATPIGTIGIGGGIPGSRKNRVRVKGGFPTIVGLSITDLSPTAANGAVSGRVTSKNGAPLPGVTVTLRDNTGGGGLRHTVTDAQGRYSFTEVETNNLYTIIVARRSFGFTPANRTFGFEGDTSEVDFVAIPRGRVFDRSRGRSR
ncbi:MAG: DUF4394 domain-containing protein [Pyrinomonadaceae bacterium MAG19_C2-C3]|nr:DUF4394 domain-containing protein [Pyrinomonadaceae bacterium MAG19_C2-C3]